MKVFIALMPLVLALSFSLAARSDVYEQGLAAALHNHSSTINDFAHFQLATKTQNALNVMVATANEALAERGFVEVAQTYQRQWEANFSQYFTSYEVFDIGDHAPLSPWLSEYYTQLREKMGDAAMKALHLDDIYTINYAIPVVFHPKGDVKGQDHWNQLEYQRHFIPFASIVTYWGSFGACHAVAIKVATLKKWCSDISMIFRNAMKSMIAPPLSDIIYNKFTGASAPAELSLVGLDEYYHQEVLKIQK